MLFPVKMHFQFALTNNFFRKKAREIILNRGKQGVLWEWENSLCQIDHFEPFSGLVYRYFKIISFAVKKGNNVILKKFVGWANVNFTFFSKGIFTPCQ